MPRYIDADKLIELATHEGAYGYVDVHDICNVPTANVVEVVRCHDCALCDEQPYKCFDGTEETLYICNYRKTYCFDGDGYCNHGFRKAEKEKTDE